jgi:hypothetical protein
MRKALQFLFIIMAVTAVLFACSKKNDGVVTFTLDKTSGTTGAYSGSRQISSGSTTAITSPGPQNVTPACSPEKNTFIPSDYEGRMDLVNATIDASNYLTARCNTGDIYIMFNQVPKADHYYTTSRVSSLYNVWIQVNTMDGRVWNPDDNQTLYVKVDQNTGIVSATMCNMQFSAQENPYTSAKVYFTADGNVSAKQGY